MSQSATVEEFVSFISSKKTFLIRNATHKAIIMRNGNGHGENIKSKLLYNSRQNTTI